MRREGECQGAGAGLAGEESRWSAGNDLRLRGGMYEAFTKECAAEPGLDPSVWPRPTDVSWRLSPRAPRLSGAGRNQAQR